MPSRPLHPDVALGIKISCVMSRNQYTKDPGPVIAELYETAGARADLLAFEVGGFLAAMDHRPEGPACKTLTDALRALGLDTAAGEAETLRNISMPRHTTRAFTGP